MGGGVQVISREIIKPSSQTPHPRQVKFSYLDKLLIKYYIPLIFFYQADESRTFSTSNYLHISQRLKHSLLHILPTFYPLAGRLKNNLSVHCNDAGADFVVARVHAHLKDVTTLDSTQLNEYLPSLDYTNPQRPLLLAQITFFDCGRVVIGACISHAVSDLDSAMVFLNAWAADCRGEAETLPPRRLSFGTASYFPSLSLLPFDMFLRFLASNEDFETRKFVFDKAKLDILRSVAAPESESESAVSDPSRVELVSAFIWKHFMAARCVDGKRRKTHAALHAINVRPRTTPSGLLENVFGNCIMSSFAVVPGSVSDEDLGLHELIGRLRRSIRKVRDGYITKPMSKESFMKDFFKLGALLMMGRLEICCFTSWRGFPTYELDYGWGKPIWFTTTFRPTRNLVVLVSSKSGDDIEAIITMMPDDLRNLDTQIKLI